MIKITINLIAILTLMVACKPANDTMKHIDLKKDMVIAHRGTTYWAPEGSEAALLWARNIGTDYLEVDVQPTKDSILVVFHDKNLSRTSNVSEKFPEKIKSRINEFTLKELRSLDIGSWFNQRYPDRAREGFVELKITTLQDALMIAEGNRIKKKKGKPEKEMKNGQWTGHYIYEKDPNDIGHRPGIYAETKNPLPNTESLLAEEISRYGWNINNSPKEIKTTKNKVSIGNSNARFVLQSFYPESIKKLELLLPNLPKCYLLSQPRMKDDLKGNYIKAIEFSKEQNVRILGPNITKKSHNFETLIHEAGLVIHPYTFNTLEELNHYKGKVDGGFTNRADLMLEFFDRKSPISPSKILDNLGY